MEVIKHNSNTFGATLSPITPPFLRDSLGTSGQLYLRASRFHVWNFSHANFINFTMDAMHAMQAFPNICCCVDVEKTRDVPAGSIAERMKNDCHTKAHVWRAKMLTCPGTCCQATWVQSSQQCYQRQLYVEMLQDTSWHAKLATQPLLLQGYVHQHNPFKANTCT
jgi:hypothetical protein